MEYGTLLQLYNNAIKSNVLFILKNPFASRALNWNAVAAASNK